MRRCKLEGCTLSRPVHSCITIHITELHFLECYHLAVHAQNHLPWVWTTRCCVYEVCPTPYHKNDCRGHHIRALGDLVEKISSWWKNGTWIYANHHDPYNLTVNCVLLNHWVCCNGYLECSAFFGCTTTGGMKYCPSARVNMITVHQNSAHSPVWVLHSQ